MKNVALYVRVSTQEQKLHGLSVDTQIEALQEYCTENGYNIVGIYNDAGISARKSYKKRPALLKLVSDCEKGMIDLILFTKLDRYFRSVSDYYAIQGRLDACHVPWRAIWEDYETETSSGVFKVNIMLSVAQSEADRTSDRVKAAYEFKRAQGWHIGTAPLGYKVEGHYLVKDESEAEAVQLMFDTYLETFSITKTSLAMYEKGFPSNQNGIKKKLHNPIYYGNDNGVKCPAYISKADYDLIQTNMTRHTRNCTPTRKYLFSGLCTCSECGCRMHSSFAKNVKGVEYKFYRCSGQTYSIKHPKPVSKSERKIEQYLIENVDGLLSEYNAEIDVADIQLSDKELKKQKDRLERLKLLFEMGDISLDSYKEKSEKLKQTIARLEIQSGSKSKIELPSNWLEMYNELTPEHKRSWWSSLIKEIVISKDDIRIVWR